MYYLMQWYWLQNFLSYRLLFTGWPKSDIQIFECNMKSVRCLIYADLGDRGNMGVQWERIRSGTKERIWLLKDKI